MRTYIRESKDLGNGKRMITHYTLGESLMFNIIKLILFIFIVWPVEILWIVFKWLMKLVAKLLKYVIKAIVKLVTLPFRH